MCELLVGLPAVTVLAVEDLPGQPLRVHIETRGDRPGCRGCGGRVVVKERLLDARGGDQVRGHAERPGPR
jgi:DNA-directed RNA polymerase subunit RPC12/RpoP